MEHQSRNRRKHRKHKQYIGSGGLYVVLIILGIVAVAIGFGIHYVAFHFLKETESPSPMQFLITSLFSLLVFVAVLSQVAIYLFQWFAMRDVIRQNERLIRVSQRQARAAENSLKQNNSVVVAAQRQAKAAEDALMHSRDSLIDSERAYLGVKRIDLMRPLALNEHPLVKVYFVNGGRTPARNIHVKFITHVTDRYHPDTLLHRFVAPDAGPFDVLGRIGILPAGEVYEDAEPIELLGLINQPEWGDAFTKIPTGEVNFYLFGCAQFTDFQNRTREFRFISIFNFRTGRGFVECGSREKLIMQVDDVVGVGKGQGFDIQDEDAKKENKGKNPN